MFPLLLLIVSLIASMLVGYIVGKGAIKPIPIRHAASSSSSSSTSSPSKHSTQSHAQHTHASSRGTRHGKHMEKESKETEVVPSRKQSRASSLPPPLNAAHMTGDEATTAEQVTTAVESSKETSASVPTVGSLQSAHSRPSDSFLHSMTTPNPDAESSAPPSSSSAASTPPPHSVSASPRPISSEEDGPSSPLVPPTGGVGGAGTGSTTGVPMSASTAASMNTQVARRGSRRVVIAAKQLPLITRKDPGTGKWTIEWEDNRNFLSGLKTLRRFGYDVKWVGMPNTCGVPVGKDEQDDYEEMVMEHDCVPVFLPPLLADKFVNGFCKSVLWPMLHYVLPQSNLHFSARWDELWQAYTAANSLFASVASHCVDSSTDTIWIHNYHLLLLPSFIRTKLPRAKIGLFVHTPWPSSDVFRVLPTRQNILSSIMAADLLGFHTFDYARHFLSCIKRVMDLDFETLPGGALGVKYNGRFVSMLISHVGLDANMFARTQATEEVQKLVVELREKYGERRIIFSASDLDSVKGGLLKLQAYARFFDRYPNWKDQVVFVEVQTPNRSVTLDYSVDLEELLKEQVDKIHAKHGKEVLHHLVLDEQLPLKQQVAYYSLSDVCMVSQFWDGLNLLPFEYTAAQPSSDPGALVISEFMGCSRALNGVIRVNPWSLDMASAAINDALQMTLAERRANHSRRFNYVMNHTIERWGLTFLEHLDRATKLCEGMSYVQVGWGSNVKLMGLRSDFTHLDEELVTAAYRRAERRVLLLDYDGTLTSAEKTAHKSRLMGPSSKVKRLLRDLSRDPENVVFIMSGRTRSTLTEWFPVRDFPELGLAAEKGLFLRWPQRLAMQCRQDIRRDPLIRKRVEEGKREKEKAEEEERKKNAQITSEMRSQTFRQQSEHKKPSVEDNTTKTSPAPDNSSVMTGDAHLLVEEASVAVDDTEWEYMIALDDAMDWKHMALEIIRSYTAQTDGSWIEDKEFAVVWHYEQADPEYGRMQSSELQKYLVKILANPSVDVVRYDYNRILEVKPHGVSKGLAATAILEELFYLPSTHTHPHRKRDSRPTSPIEDGHYCHHHSHGRPHRNSYTGSSGVRGASPDASPRGPPRTATGAVGAFNPPMGANAALPPFLFCVGDDRSDEDMFLSVQNKDYLEGCLRSGFYASLHPPHAPHPYPTHSYISGTEMPGQEKVKRSITAVTTAAAAHHHKQGGLQRGERDRESGGRERGSSLRNNEAGEDAAGSKKKEKEGKKTTDPFTFTVCVGMKPSNAHYYLHDDEEVIRLLSALATSSQRMAQTRAADTRAYQGMMIPPPNLNTLQAVPAMGRPARGSLPSLQSLRPADIPTSPPLSVSGAAPVQHTYTLQKATEALQRLKRQQRQRGHEPESASEDELDEGDDDDDDENDDDDDDSDEEELMRQKQMARRSGLLGGAGFRPGGGFRRG